MKYETSMMGWPEPDDRSNDEEVLDPTELNRLAYRIEHPDLDDPVFLYLHKKRGEQP